MTIESDNESETEKAKEKFCSLIPPGILMNYDCSPLEDVVTKYERFLEEQKERRTLFEDSLQKIE